MMTLLERYLAGAVVRGILVALGVLMPLLAFFILAEEAERIGTGDYDTLQALAFVALSLPRQVYQIFPFITLIGAVLGLGLLASRSELVAMRAAGVSIAQIARGALLGGVLATVVALALGEIVAPWAEQQARALRSSAQTGQSIQFAETELWARDGPTFINVREILPGPYLRNLSIYELDGDRLRVASHAAEAHYRDGAWVLRDLVRTVIDDASTRVERQAEARWYSLLQPEILRLLALEPQALSLPNLQRYIRFLRASAQDASRYEVAFWSRLVHPLLALATILVATPLLLGSSRSSGLGLRMFVSIPIGMGFYVLHRTFAHLALGYGLHPALAAFVPLMVFLSIAGWLLRRLG